MYLKRCDQLKYQYDNDPAKETICSEPIYVLCIKCSKCKITDCTVNTIYLSRILSAILRLFQLAYAILA